MHRNGVYISFLLLLLAASAHSLSDFPECIRYEFHDHIANKSFQTQDMMHDCDLHNGYIDKLTVANISSRPLFLNTTFECCGKPAHVQTHYFHTPFSPLSTLTTSGQQLRQRFRLPIQFPV